MAGPALGMNPALADLLASPATYELFAAVDLLERHLPPAQPVGCSDSPRNERIRFHHSSAMHVEIGELVDLELRGDPHVAHLGLTLLGLCGASTPMPLYMAEEADQDDEQGAAIRGVLDLLHHRLFSLLVRGVRSVDIPGSLRADGSDPWSQRLFALLGQDDRSGLPRASLLRLAPIVASGVRSPAMLAAALRICLGDHLGPATLHIEALSGGWTALDESQWNRLGSSTSRLDDNAVLGTEVIHPAGAAQVVIGPLDGERYKLFTPGGPAHALACAVTDGFTPEPIHYDLVLEIEDYDYPAGLLGMRRLAQDLWLARDEHLGLSTRMIVPATKPDPPAPAGPAQSAQANLR